MARLLRTLTAAAVCVTFFLISLQSVEGLPASPAFSRLLRKHTPSLSSNQETSPSSPEDSIHNVNEASAVSSSNTKDAAFGTHTEFASSKTPSSSSESAVSESLPHINTEKSFSLINTLRKGVSVRPHVPQQDVLSGSFNEKPADVAASSSDSYYSQAFVDDLNRRSAISESLKASEAGGINSSSDVSTSVYDSSATPLSSSPLDSLLEALMMEGYDLSYLLYGGEEAPSQLESASDFPSAEEEEVQKLLWSNVAAYINQLNDEDLMRLYKELDVLELEMADLLENEEVVSSIDNLLASSAAKLRGESEETASLLESEASPEEKEAFKKQFFDSWTEIGQLLSEKLFEGGDLYGNEGENPAEDAFPSALQYAEMAEFLEKLMPLNREQMEEEGGFSAKEAVLEEVMGSLQEEWGEDALLTNLLVDQMMNGEELDDKMLQRLTKLWLEDYQEESERKQQSSYPLSEPLLAKFEGLSSDDIKSLLNEAYLAGRFDEAAEKADEKATLSLPNLSAAYASSTHTNEAQNEAFSADSTPESSLFPEDSEEYLELFIDEDGNFFKTYVSEGKTSFEDERKEEFLEDKAISNDSPLTDDDIGHLMREKSKEGGLKLGNSLEDAIILDFLSYLRSKSDIRGKEEVAVNPLGEEGALPTSTFKAEVNSPEDSHTFEGIGATHTPHSEAAYAQDSGAMHTQDSGEKRELDLPSPLISESLIEKSSPCSDFDSEPSSCTRLPQCTYISSSDADEAAEPSFCALNNSYMEHLANTNCGTASKGTMMSIAEELARFNLIELPRLFYLKNKDDHGAICQSVLYAYFFQPEKATYSDNAGDASVEDSEAVRKHFKNIGDILSA